MDEDVFFRVAAGLIVFGFASIISVFVGLLTLGSINNYAASELSSLGYEFVANGMIPSSFSSILDDFGVSNLQILEYLDFYWLIVLILFVGSSIIYSYYATRQDYLSIFSFAIIGLILFVYIGGIFLQLTTWFKDSVLGTVFPTYSSIMPFFSWYVDNMIIFNSIVLVVCIITNYLPADFLKFSKRKQGDSIEQI